jgi:hypothetical protein
MEKCALLQAQVEQKGALVCSIRPPANPKKEMKAKYLAITSSNKDLQQTHRDEPSLAIPLYQNPCQKELPLRAS